MKIKSLIPLRKIIPFAISLLVMGIGNDKKEPEKTGCGCWPQKGDEKKGDEKVNNRPGKNKRGKHSSSNSKHTDGDEYREDDDDDENEAEGNIGFNIGKQSNKKGNNSDPSGGKKGMAKMGNKHSVGKQAMEDEGDLNEESVGKKASEEEADPNEEAVEQEAREEAAVTNKQSVGKEKTKSQESAQKKQAKGNDAIAYRPEAHKDPNKDLAKIISKHMDLGEIVDRGDDGKFSEEKIKTILMEELKAQCSRLDLEKIEISSLSEKQITIVPKSGNNYYHGTASATFSRKNLNLSQIITTSVVNHLYDQFETVSPNGALSEADIPKLEEKLQALIQDLKMEKIKIEIDQYSDHIKVLPIGDSLDTSCKATSYYFGIKKIKYSPLRKYEKNFLAKLVNKTDPLLAYDIKIEVAYEGLIPSDHQFKKALKEKFPELDIDRIKVQQRPNLPNYVMDIYNNPDCLVDSNTYFGIASLPYTTEEEKTKPKQD